MAGEWDVVERAPIGRKPPPMTFGGMPAPAPTPEPGDEWAVVSRAPLAQAAGQPYDDGFGAAQAQAPKTQVGLGDAAARAAKGMFASSAQKAGVLATTLPAMGIQALSNLITGKEGDTSITDYQRSRFVAPWERMAQENAIQPTEELTGPGMVGHVGGSIGGMVPDMIMGGPGRKVAEEGLSVLQAAIAKFMAQTPSAANMAATNAFNTTNQLQASGVPKEVADRAAIASYPTNVAAFALPLTVQGTLLPRAGMGALGNAGMDIPATMQENQVLRDAGQGKFAQNPLDPAHLGTSAGMGAVLGALLGQRAPSLRQPLLPPVDPAAPPVTPGPTTAERIYQNLVRQEPDRATRNETRKGIAEAFTAGKDPVIRRDSVMPDQETGELVPLGEAAVPATDKAGNTFTKPEDLAVARQSGADPVREAYLRAGLNPDSQANAMRRQAMAPDDSQDVRTVKGQLDEEQVGLVTHYMGVPADELAQLGPNSQRRLLARAMEARDADTARADQGALHTTFEGGDERSSPASKPNVPGDRMAGRSEFEDQNARMAQDQEAADLNALRERAASGDKQAIGELRKKEADARKASRQKTDLINKLQDLRQQRDALANSTEYNRLKRTRDLKQELTEDQQKALDGYDAQHAKLGDAIYSLEGRIYDLSAKADLASVSASGKGDRPFRGFPEHEAEHAGMFEGQARAKASAAEQEMLDRLEAEWRAREKQRTQRDPRQREQPQDQPTGDGTAESVPPKDGVFETNEDGFVNSTNGNPIHFGHQRDAGWWILKTGNKQSGGQVFEIANHPSGKGFTVRETHRNAPGGGPKGEPGGAGPKQGGDAGPGGPMAVRGNEPRAEANQAKAETKQGEAAPKAEPQPAPQPKAKRERARPPRDLLQMIRSWGGISPLYRGDVTGEDKGSFGNVFREGGIGMDEIAQRMHDEGFLRYDQFHDDADNMGIGHATDLVRRALDGEKILNEADMMAAHERQQAADYKQHLVDEIEGKGIQLKKHPNFMKPEELEAALAEHEAKAEAERQALKGQLDEAYDEAAKVLGDRVSSLLTSAEGKDIKTWYRENIAVLERAIEDEHAYNENLSSRQADAGREEESNQPGREDGAAQAHEENAGRQPGEDEDEPGFRLDQQSEAELKARADAQAKAKAEEDAAQRKAEADAREAREKKEIESRQQASAENYTLGQSAEDSLSGQGDLLSGGGKSDAGSLYANPFHKALGWALGDSRAWAKSLTEFGKSVRDVVKSGGAGNALASFARAFFDSSSAAMRAAVRQAGNSRTAQWVIDQFHDEAGSGRATGETYGEAVSARVNRRLVQVHELLGDLVHDEPAMKQLANLVRSGVVRSGTRLGDAAIEIRKMLDEELAYLRDAGVDLGEVKNGYFPREYVTEQIIKHGQRFIDAATQAYIETGLKRDQAVKAAKELHDSLVYGEHGDIFKSQGGAGQAPFLKGRVFGKAVDNPSHPLHEFLNHNAGEVLTQYFQRAAKRAEIARRFGDNFSRWRDYKDAKGKMQEGLLTRIEKEGGQAALSKLQEYIGLAAGIRAYGLGAGALRTASIMRTWGALSFLEKATLSSLTEFIVPAMRSGNVLDAGRGLVNVISDLFVRTKDAQARRAIAEDLGLVAGHIDGALSAARFAGGEPVGKVESKVLDRFFKRTGLSQWTDATRVAATDTGRVFVRRLAKDVAGKLNARYLADLGIPADKVDAFKRFVLSKNDGMPGVADLRGEMGDLYRTAIRKFVSQSVMNPSAVTKPSWMSHPVGAVIGQLQSFNYAFYENVIKRNVRLARESATGSGYSNLERAKMIMPMVISPLLIAAAYAIGEGRDALLGDPNRRKEETTKDKLLKAASRGMPIAPLDPLINFVSSAKYQRGAAQTFAGPVAGVAATGIDAARDAFLNNSPKTNTQERAAAKAVWDIFIEPSVNLALYASPVSPISAAITQAAGSGHVRENLFVGPLAGPKRRPGDSERLSPR